MIGGQLILVACVAGLLACGLYALKLREDHRVAEAARQAAIESVLQMFRDAAALIDSLPPRPSGILFGDDALYLVYPELLKPPTLGDPFKYRFDEPIEFRVRHDFAALDVVYKGFMS